MREFHDNVGRGKSCIIRKIGADSEGTANLVLAVFLNFQCLREVESVAEDDCFGSGSNAQFFLAGYQLIDKIKLIAGIAAHSVE